MKSRRTANIVHLFKPEIVASYAHKELSAAKETLAEMVAAAEQRGKDEAAAINAEIEALVVE
jgi:hypothetical protein